MAQRMRGVSAGSLAEVLEAVENSTGTLSTVGDELFSVAAVLDATPSVRRVLTDPATEPDARSGLAAAVLGDKIDIATLGIVDVAAQHRWASGRDLSDAFELAGLAAHVAAADKSGSLDELENELFEAQRLIDQSRELRGVLSDRTIAAEHKGTLIDTIFKNKISASTLALLKQAAATRAGTFDAVLERFADEVAARRKRLLAEVRTAYELGDAERNRLAEALSSAYGHDVHLNVIVDPSIVGGLRVSIGDEVIDGTVSGRLEDARRQLAG
ncbi:F0F1 ATP synthase subunit delta [Aeromicrobium sp.]|jgi:F-type H+-transporting ATPase subunit delta|uniref:F0F1 ATP synthase subunit delta n=1 Tax=Aeromicrobium sp. TaxID=1871063 RepID=UPI003C54BA75